MSNETQNFACFFSRTIFVTRMYAHWLSSILQCLSIRTLQSALVCFQLEYGDSGSVEQLAFAYTNAVMKFGTEIFISKCDAKLSSTNWDHLLSVLYTSPPEYLLTFCKKLNVYPDKNPSFHKNQVLDEICFIGIELLAGKMNENLLKCHINELEAFKDQTAAVSR